MTHPMVVVLSPTRENVFKNTSKFNILRNSVYGHKLKAKEKALLCLKYFKGFRTSKYNY